MAIYHLEAKAISRGVGRSAVAASAYMSCSRLYNDYDGIQHDYTRKQGLAWQQVFLPCSAPAEWLDREVLWNAVESAEKSKDSRLAKEIILALPRELGKDEWIALMNSYIQTNFTADGMCADVSIHTTDEKNPHAHVLLTVRPLDEKGKWQYKTQKEYLCVKDGVERGFTSTEFQSAQDEGWEKQYLYRVGKKKQYLTASEATLHGYERINKYPKSTQYGRQNPITQRWNSEEQLIAWRASWADVVNGYLAQAGHVERIDHRSHAERGLMEQPTIHEGVFARVQEKRGMVSERCEINRQIRADNQLLKMLKRNYEALAKIVDQSVSAVAEQLEKFRQRLFIVCYQQQFIAQSKQTLSQQLQFIAPDVKRYFEIKKELHALRRKQKNLLQEQKATPLLHVLKRAELSKEITTVVEQWEEMKTEQHQLLHSFEAKDDTEMKVYQQQAQDMESTLQKLENSEVHFSDELKKELDQYHVQMDQSSALDAVVLNEERQKLRPRLMQKAKAQLSQTYGQRYDAKLAQQAEKDMRILLDEKAPSTLEQLRIVPKKDEVSFQQGIKKYTRIER